MPARIQEFRAAAIFFLQEFIFNNLSLSLPPEKEKFSFLNISHKVQKVLKCLRHQQGVTKNKLYNAKG